LLALQDVWAAPVFELFKAMGEQVVIGKDFFP
jgi:hypothetical protein